jgi:SHS2 domain-containing protein
MSEKNVLRRPFEWVEHPSDIGFRAYGEDLPKAFENAGLALFEIMTDTGKVEPRKRVEIELLAEDPGALLYDWLDRLIALHDSEGLLFSKFEVEIERMPVGLRLKGKAWGEFFDPSKHPERTAVKAMTYHLMEIHEDPAGCWVQAVVDI